MGGRVAAYYHARAVPSEQVLVREGLAVGWEAVRWGGGWVILTQIVFRGSGSESG